MRKRGESWLLDPPEKLAKHNAPTFKTLLNWLVADYEDLVYHGGLDPEDVDVLADSLKRRSRLRKLDLSENSLIDAEAMAILDALKANTTIVELNLGELITPQCLKEIQALVTRNRNIAQNPKEARLLAGALTQDNAKAPWHRAKLMVVGEGRAGKTATVRALLDQPFLPHWKSTIGVNLIESKTKKDGSWTQCKGKPNFASQLVSEIVVFQKPEHVQEQKIPATRMVVPKALDEPEWRLYKTKSFRKLENDELELIQNFDHELFAEAKQDDIKLTIWDYGGQTVFYTLHHLFLTQYGVYLLVFDMTLLLDYDENESMEYLSFWLHSVRLHAHEAPLLLVGTFLDKLDVEDLTAVNLIVTSITSDFAQIQGSADFDFFPIDNKSATGLVELRKAIQAITSKQKYVQKEVSVQWMRTLDSILSEGLPWLTLTDVIEIAEEEGVTDPDELDDMLALLHELGMILHFTATTRLREIVTVDPQWLVDCISLIIRDETHTFNNDIMEKAGLQNDVNQLFTTGIASRDLLDYLWEGQNPDFLLDLVRNLLLLSNWRFGTEPGELFLLPSMVKTLTQPPAVSGVQMIYHFDFLPIGVFERLVCLCVEHSAANATSAQPTVGKDICKVYFGKEQILYLQRDSTSISIFTPVGSEAVNYTIILAMMRKLREDVMGKGLEWRMDVEVSGEMQSVEEAIAFERDPWFGPNASKRESLKADDVDIDEFLKHL